MSESGERGRRAEGLALEFLEERGLVLLDRNWRSGHRELDLVMKSFNCKTGKELVHIVEVRSLSEPNLQMPFETIDKVKRRNLIRAAAGYVYKKRVLCETQFDVISILFCKDKSVRIEYFPDAFTPQW